MKEFWKWLQMDVSEDKTFLIYRIINKTKLEKLFKVCSAIIAFEQEKYINVFLIRSNLWNIVYHKLNKVFNIFFKLLFDDFKRIKILDYHYIWIHLSSLN